MGLDSVELVMEVEDRFKIKLTEAECSSVRTVAELAALVFARLPGAQGLCPAMRAFHELRRLLIAQVGIERGLIRPQARLDALLSHDRWRCWRKLRKQNRRIPRLVATDRGSMLALTVGATFTFLWFVSCTAIWQLGEEMAIPASFLALTVWILGVAGVCELSRRHFPTGLETVGDLARMVSPMELPRSSAGKQPAMQQFVLEEIRRLTAEQLGIPLERIQPGSDFVKDLGFN
ncbi:MAG TPA: hypothetical protein VGM03_06625 [Phycisphaerae bacterium]|jgi:acyl carrier protein